MARTASHSVSPNRLTTGVTTLSEQIKIRPVKLEDLDALEALEKRTFEVDRLSRRSLRRWINSEHRAFKVALVDGVLAGYVLIILHRGTSLARLYSIAVDSAMRGRGLGRKLIEVAETASRAAGRIDMRLRSEEHTSELQSRPHL